MKNSSILRLLNLCLCALLLAFWLTTAASSAGAQTPQPSASLSQTASSTQTATADVQLTLDQAMTQFLARNPALAAARSRVESARANQIAARLRPNPSLLFSAENLKLGSTSPFTVPFTRLYEIGPTFTQTIELGGKRQRRMDVADLSVSVADAELLDELRRRTLDVRRAFYEVVLARHLLEVTLEQRSYFEELVRFNQVRLDEGAIAGSELLKVKLERVKFDAVVAQARLVVRQAGIRLLELLGETTPGVQVTVVGDLGFTPLGTDLAALREQALRERPDLQAAERGTQLADRRIALERARSVPDITPYAGYKRIGVDNTLQFGVTIPLFVNNRNQAEIARAMADEKTAAAELAVVRNRLLAEVETAYRAYETGRAQVMTFQRELLNQADQSREIAQVAYREGATDLLPLLEAQRTRTEIRQQYFRTLFDYQLSILQLEAAVGGEIKP
ncbi:MAG: TolC family protein [Blastocatellales bacterium]|nr:TolC family protein [Nitrosomonas nitrosa]